MGSRRTEDKRAGILVWALAGIVSALLQMGCSGSKTRQILCTLSKDSIPVFNFRELAESAKLARDAYRDSAANFATYAAKYRVEMFPLPKSAGQVLLLVDTLDAPPYEYVCSEASSISFASGFWSDILGKEKDRSTSLEENVVFHRDRHYVEKLESLDQVRIL